jgi:hypothetical protein
MADSGAGKDDDPTVQERKGRFKIKKVSWSPSRAVPLP